jgi:peptidoglycan/xylan/chitin deacetylase (PgdA/CDA1 family)
MLSSPLVIESHAYAKPRRDALGIPPPPRAPGWRFDRHEIQRHGHRLFAHEHAARTDTDEREPEMTRASRLPAAQPDPRAEGRSLTCKHVVLKASHSGAEKVDPGPFDRLCVTIEVGGRALPQIATPALGVLSKAEAQAYAARRLSRRMLGATLRQLRPWWSMAFWAATLGVLFDLDGLSLGGIVSGRWRGDVGLSHLKVALAAGVRRCLRAGEGVGLAAAGSHAGERAAIEAGVAAEFRGRLDGVGIQVGASAAALGRPKASPREVTSTLPILMYHRVAPAGLAALDRYRVTPERFAEHMALLRVSGFRTVGLAELSSARARGKPLRGRPILVTFDDGYVDFAEYAWPILKRNGFGALLFVVTERVGGKADWDAEHGAPARLLDWPRLRFLQAEGLEIGSHGATHRKLSELSTADIYREALRSRYAIAAELGGWPTSFCYPHGDFDDVVAAVVDDCGFEMGFSCSAGPSGLGEDPFGLSRVEVTGADDSSSLAAKLGLS